MSLPTTRPGPLGFSWAWVNTTMFNHKINAKSGASSCCSRTYRFIKSFFELAWEFRILIMIVDRWSLIMWKAQSGAGTEALYVKSESLLAINPVRQSWPDFGTFPSRYFWIPLDSFTPCATNNKWQRWCGLATHANSSARIIKQQIIQLALNPPPVRPVISAKQMRTHRVNRNRKRFNILPSNRSRNVLEAKHLNKQVITITIALTSDLGARTMHRRQTEIITFTLSGLWSMLADKALCDIWSLIFDGSSRERNANFTRDDTQMAKARRDGEGEEGEMLGTFTIPISLSV